MFERRNASFPEPGLSLLDTAILGISNVWRVCLNHSTACGSAKIAEQSHLIKSVEMKHSVVIFAIAKEDDHLVTAVHGMGDAWKLRSLIRPFPSSQLGLDSQPWGERGATTTCASHPTINLTSSQTRLLDMAVARSPGK